MLLLRAKRGDNTGVISFPPAHDRRVSIAITVGSRIEVSLAGCPDAAVERLKDAFTHRNPDRAKWVARGKRGKPPPEFVRTWREGTYRGSVPDLSLPRGGWDRVERILKGEFGLSFKVLDERVARPGEGPLGLRLSVEPYDFQERMIAAALESEQGILRGPTGCGKTIVAQAFAIATGSPTVVLVPTSKIHDDWLERMPREIGIHPDNIGVIRGSTRKIRPITVALVHSYALRAEEYADVFGTFIFDEVWRAAAATFYRAADTSRARYRIGMSADERRKDKKEFLIYDAFGELLVDVSRKDLIATGAILDTEIRLVPTGFDAPWYREIDRQRRANGEGYDRLLHQMSRDEARNRLILDLAIEEVHAGSQVLCFAHRVEHCATLRADMSAAAGPDFRSGVIVGDGQGFEQESASTMAGMRDGSVMFAAGTYQSIGAGVNLPAVGVGIAATPIHSNRGFFGQVRGRVGRSNRAAGKTRSVLYVPWDRAIHGLAPLRAMVRWNKTVAVLDAGQWREGRVMLRELEAEEAGDDLDLSMERSMIGQIGGSK